MFEDDEQLGGEVDDANAHVCAAQCRMLSLIAPVDRQEAWRDSGARDTAHWLGMRYGISGWKAQRWIAAASALEGLPRLSDAFSRGEIGIDKVVELTRFATAESEAGRPEGVRYRAGPSTGAGADEREGSPLAAVG
jgi:hypothetical protein